MKYKIGFIGSGNMATAMLGGILHSNLVQPEQIILSNPSQLKVDKLIQKYGVQGTISNRDVASSVEILILAVKPNLFPQIINEIKNSVNESTIIVSIAAGQTIEMIENSFEKSIKLVRTMPNTPALVGEGMSAIMPNKQINEQELVKVIEIFNSFGQTEIVPESLVDAVVAVSGSSPAYVYVMIEAMADAAVLQGMSRQMAYQFASQAVLGAAKMVLETGIHPGILKDQVCSPGGTTIEAIISLEKSGFRGDLMNAMESCSKKSKEMAKNETNFNENYKK